MYYGTDDQGPDPSLEAIHGVGNTPCYPRRAYFVVVDDDETDTRGAANQYQVEVIATGTVETNCAEDGLLAWWPLDDAAPTGTARELVEGRDGVYSSGVAGGGALSAGGGGSVVFNEFGEYMRVADVGSLARPKDMTDWTVSVWFSGQTYMGSNGGGSVAKLIANFGGDYLAGQWAWTLAQDNPNTLPDKNLRPYSNYNVTSGGSSSLNGANPVSFGGSHLLMATWKKNTGDNYGTYTLYLDGVQVDQKIDQRQSRYEAGEVQVGGGYAYSSSYQFFGSVADLKYYSRAFTSSQASAAYMSVDDWTLSPDGGGVWVNAQGDVYVECAPRSTTTTPQWKDVATEICRRASPALIGHIDFDNMTDEVPGFLLGNTSLKASDYLRTLLAFYFADAPEYDDKIRTIKRGGAISGTLDQDDLLRVEDQDDDMREQAIAGWKRLTLIYPDPENNYVATPQTAPRSSPDVEASSEVKIECPIPFDADIAAQIADKLQKIKFCELEGTFSRAFTAEYDLHVPSDPVEWDDRRFLLTKKSFDLGMVKLEGRYDRASAYVSYASGTRAPAPTKQTSNTKGPTVLAAFNSPSLRSSDAVPGIYVAARGILSGWTGCLVQVSVDNQASWINTVQITAPSIIGKLVNDVGTGSAREPITVQLGPDQQVETITDDQIDAGLNRFVMVTAGMAEVCQFKTADENSDGTFDLTDVTSAELGTAEVDHAAGARFVLIDPTVIFLPIDASFAGQPIYLRGVTLGTAEANNQVQSLVFDPPTYIIDGGDFFVMSDVIIPYRFKVLGNTAAFLAAENGIAKDRELVFETDTLKMKLGDGVTHYNSLPYVTVGGGDGDVRDYWLMG